MSKWYRSYCRLFKILGHIDNNIWVAVGLEKPSGIELKNTVLSAILDTKTSFTDKEWLDISESFENKDLIINNRHYIKSINEIYYKPFANNFPTTDGQINCKSCNDGYLLEMKIPSGRTCALGMGCPPPVGRCITPFLISNAHFEMIFINNSS